MILAEKIAVSLGSARRSGAWWRCRCPVHDSRGPTLALRDGERGLLVKCFAGCEARDVFAAWVAQSPGDPYLQLDLATAYQGMGRMDLAEPLYRKVLVDGRNVVPMVTTNAGDEGKTLATIACENLKIGLASNPGC